MIPRHWIVAGLLASGTVAAQEPLWQVFGPAQHYRTHLCPFPDFNQDGFPDLMEQVFPSILTSNVMEARILSGIDGHVLWRDSLNARTTVAVGDMDGDGWPDFANLWPNFTFANPGATPPILAKHKIQVWSPRQRRLLWEVLGNQRAEFGFSMIGDLDTDGDGRPNFVTLTWYPTESDVYVYDHRGVELYRIPMLPLGVMSISLCAMGDMDGDGCDDFIVGCADVPLQRGAVLLVSGQTGTILRTSYGLQAGDKTFDKATNLGDIDGDGLNDYAAFPWWSSQRWMAVCWSGATGNVIRTVPEYAETVVANQDLDLDGVNDLVLGWEYPVQLPNVYGRSLALSGRDGTELWRVENYYGSGMSSSGWARYGAGLGVQPGSPYPVLAWMDLDYQALGVPSLALAVGRIRAFRAQREGQGPVVGTPCSSSGALPQIGVRQTATGSRITVAKGPAGSLGLLSIAFGTPTTYQGLPLPIALDGLGWSGCQLYVGPDVALATVLGTAGIDRGYAAVDLGVGLAATQGTIVQAQWLLFDPTGLDYAVTARHQLRLQ